MGQISHIQEGFTTVTGTDATYCTFHNGCQNTHVCFFLKTALGKNRFLCSNKSLICSFRNR